MIYLLGQILLCLLLAALAGWFIGWSWRGFREQDRVEDLRRTLRATEEVKDRDLAETQRREEALRSRVEVLERRAERLADELSSARRGDDDIAGAGGAPTGESRRRPEPRADSIGNDDVEAAQPVPFRVEIAEIQGLRGKLGRLEEQLERERRSRSEAEEALHEKTAALLSLQAELGGLRSGTEERAGDVARLERRVVELEPLEERLRRRDEELREIQARLQEATRDRRTDEERARDLDRQTAAMEQQLRERDRRINELRNDYNDAVARLESVEAERERLRGRIQEAEADHDEVVRYRSIAAEAPQLQERLQECSRRLQQVEGQLDEARTALQRQIERNRKQEAVHQQVVANLRAELRERDSGKPEQHPASGAEREDDLQRISGIGPKIEELLNALGVTRYEQIARWDEDDIDRVSARLGPFASRIRRDDWIEGARRQHVLKYGTEPGS